MPKEVLSKEPVSLPEVVSIYKKREKDGELNYLQRIALEHAQRSSEISKTKAKKLVKKLMGEFELEEKTALTIVNFMPVNIDELRIFLQNAKKVYKTDELHSMLELLREEE